MDPMSALGLAANVIQIVDFSSRLMTATYEIYNAADGQLVEHSELGFITHCLTTHIQDLDESLKAKKLETCLSQSDRDQARLGLECKDVALELLAALNELKAQGKHKRWRSFRQALLTIWYKGRIEAFERRLNRFRQQLIVDVFIKLRVQVEEANHQQAAVLDNVDNIKENTQYIGQAFLGHIEDSKRWQEDLIEAIHQKNWQAPYGQSVLKPFSGVSGTARAGQVDELTKRLLNRLRFHDVEDRHARIAQTFEKTFEWIYREEEGTKPWTSFVRWLEKEAGIYWITGKAGCGKSTFMKYLYNNESTVEHLNKWSSQHMLATAAFFFWNSGSKMQMSQMGLLQSLLWDVLRQYPTLIPKIMPERWEVFSLFGEDPHPWAWPELLKAMRVLIKENGVDMKFCFFIDGLDEFDGDHSELIDLLQEIVIYPHVKICASSRPWVIFEDAFKSRPNLMLHDLTYGDIHDYVNSKFHLNLGFVELEEREPEYAATLLENISIKASGVFLWVRLVVASLLTGLTNGDRVSDLQRRLEQLPQDLEDLFQKILDSLDPFYLEHASQLFQLVKAAFRSPTLLDLSFADEEDPELVYRLPVKPLSEGEKLSKVKAMKRRLNSRCKGLLEAAPTSHRRPVSAATEIGESEYVDPRLITTFTVQYLHRSVRDFFKSPDVWKKLVAATKGGFNPYIRLCKSSIMQLKVLCPDRLELDQFWDCVMWSVEYAKQAELCACDEQNRLLDEIDRAAGELASAPSTVNGTLLKHYANYNGLFVRDGLLNPDWTQTRFYWIQQSSFLHLAAMCNLHKYLDVKLSRRDFDSKVSEMPSLLDAAISRFDDFAAHVEKPLCSQSRLPIQTIKLLLEKGANPNEASNSLGNIIYEAGVDRRNSGQQAWINVIELFIQHGADPRIDVNIRDMLSLRKFDMKEVKRLEELLEKKKAEWPQPYNQLLNEERLSRASAESQRNSSRRSRFGKIISRIFCSKPTVAPEPECNHSADPERRSSTSSQSTEPPLPQTRTLSFVGAVWGSASDLSLSDPRKSKAPRKGLPSLR